jgi:hypothetical protein
MKSQGETRLSWRKKLEKIYEGDISAICNFLDKTEITGIIPESATQQVSSHPRGICYAPEK